MKTFHVIRLPSYWQTEICKNGSILFEGINVLPVVLHAYHDPLFLFGLVITASGVSGIP
jgi:hypothetical protein